MSQDLGLGDFPSLQVHVMMMVLDFLRHCLQTLPSIAKRH